MASGKVLRLGHLLNLAPQALLRGPSSLFIPIMQRRCRVAATGKEFALAWHFVAHGYQTRALEPNLQPISPLPLGLKYHCYAYMCLDEHCRSVKSLVGPAIASGLQIGMMVIAV